MRAASICLETTKSLTKENSIEELVELDKKINLGRERSQLFRLDQIEKAKKYDKDLRDLANGIAETTKINKYNNYIERQFKHNKFIVIFIIYFLEKTEQRVRKED